MFAFVIYQLVNIVTDTVCLDHLIVINEDTCVATEKKMLNMQRELQNKLPEMFTIQLSGDAVPYYLKEHDFFRVIPYVPNFLQPSDWISDIIVIVGFEVVSVLNDSVINRRYKTYCCENGSELAMSIVKDKQKFLEEEREKIKKLLGKKDLPTELQNPCLWTVRINPDLFEFVMDEEGFVYKESSEKNPGKGKARRPKSRRKGTGKKVVRLFPKNK